MGDADFLGTEDGRDELAVLTSPRAGRGKGVGTTFGVMLHALAFQVWRLERVYVTVLPANIPSQRSFARLGDRIDESATARGYDEAALLAAHQGRLRAAVRRRGMTMAAVLRRVDTAVHVRREGRCAHGFCARRPVLVPPDTNLY